MGVALRSGLSARGKSAYTAIFSLVRVSTETLGRHRPDLVKPLLPTPSALCLSRFGFLAT